MQPFSIAEMKKLISSPISESDATKIDAPLSAEMASHYEKAGANVSIGLYEEHYARLQRAVRAFDSWKNSSACWTNYKDVATLRGCLINAISQFDQLRVGGYFAMNNYGTNLEYLAGECCTCINKNRFPDTQYRAIKIILSQVNHWLKKVRAYILYKGGNISVLPTEYLQVAKPQITSTQKQQIPTSASPTKIIPRGGLKKINSVPKNKE